MSDLGSLALGKPSTHDHIICVAEKLFAEQGIDQISLRQITQAAEQKNASAIHYHFGSKDALVEAIYDFRMGVINTRRMQLLEALLAEARAQNLQALVDAVVQPLAEQLVMTDPPSYYVQFAARAMDHPRYYKMAWKRGRTGRALERLLSCMEEALPHVPPEVFSQRFGMMLRQVFSELSVHHQLHLSGRRRSKANTPLFVSNLVDSIAAALAAPLSPRTFEQLSSRKHT